MSKEINKEISWKDIDRKKSDFNRALKDKYDALVKLTSVSNQNEGKKSIRAKLKEAKLEIQNLKLANDKLENKVHKQAKDLRNKVSSLSDAKNRKLLKRGGFK